MDLMPPIPVVAGALLAAGTFFQIHKPVIRRFKKWLPLWQKKTSSSVRSYNKRANFSSYKKRCSVTDLSLRNRLRTPVSTPVLAPDLGTCFAPQHTSGEEMVLDDFKKVFKLCCVNEGVYFSFAVPFWKQISALKIEESSYGEIYALQHADGSSRILKCMPVDGQHPAAQTPNVTLSRALPNIVCSAYLSKLNENPFYTAPNFPRVFNICLVEGRFPELMMATWWEYRNSPERLNHPSSQPQPDLYDENQTFLTIESSFYGNSLPIDILQNAWLGASIMIQLVSALSVAEEVYHFEHRDLNLGHIRVCPLPSEAPPLKYSLGDLHFSVHTAGYQVFITDFSLSSMHTDEVVCIGNVGECTSEVVEPSVDVWLKQSNVHSLMTECLQCGSDAHVRRTNIYWLKYVNENILKCLKRNNPGLLELLDRLGQMKPIRLLQKWSECALNYNSAGEFLQDMVLKENPLVSLHE